MVETGGSVDVAIELREVTKVIGGKTVLDRINLAIPRGEFFVLVGPSGSGKSTLLKTVSGIATPESGKVWLSGRDVTGLPPYRRNVHSLPELRTLSSSRCCRERRFSSSDASCASCRA